MSVDDGAPALTDRVRMVHRSYATGVAIVTTTAEGKPYGLAVNAFTSVSLEPPLVLVCVNTTSQTHAHLYRGDHIAVNFLAHDQVELANHFARSGGEKFDSVGWHSGSCGVPVLDGISAHLELEVEQRLAAGTHTIFIGRAVAADSAARPPLVYHDGRFFDGAQLLPARASS